MLQQQAHDLQLLVFGFVGERCHTSQGRPDLDVHISVKERLDHFYMTFLRGDSQWWFLRRDIRVCAMS